MFKMLPYSPLTLNWIFFFPHKNECNVLNFSFWGLWDHGYILTLSMYLESSEDYDIAGAQEMFTELRYKFKGKYA